MGRARTNSILKSNSAKGMSCSATFFFFFYLEDTQVRQTPSKLRVTRKQTAEIRIKTVKSLYYIPYEIPEPVILKSDLLFAGMLI